MAYTKQTWQDLPSKTTPINASRLGHIEQGIYDAASTADTAASDASSAISGLANKVDKVEGKGLSTNDFTDALKTKLDNVEAGAEVNVQSDWNQSNNSADDYIKNKPSLGTSAYKNSTSVVTDSTDLVESGAVFDVVGWGNKNLIYTKLSGYNVNSSGLVQTGSTYSLAVAKVEANKEYTVSPRESFTDTNFVFAFFNSEPYDHATSYNNSRTVITSEDNSYTFTAPIDGYVGIRINTVDSTIQLEKGSTATAYEPYHASVEDTMPQVVSDAVGWDGNNKCVYPYRPSLVFPVSSASGITYTADGTNIIANGTSTNGNELALYTRDDTANTLRLPVGKYVFSGRPNIADNKIAMYVGTTKNNAYYEIVRCSSGTEVEFEITSDLLVSGKDYATISVYINIYSGVTADNLVFTPQIKRLSVDKVKADNSVIAPVENGTTVSQAYAVGSHFIRDGAFCTVTQAISSGGTLTEGTNYTSGDVADTIKDLIVAVSDSQTVSISSPNGYGTAEISFTVPTGYKYLCTVIDRIGATDSVNNIIVFLPIDNTATVSKYRMVSSTVQDLTVYVTKLYIKI